ncbi:MAG: phospho-N-acetylmuramoyl-pentapeptide-transferase, partial [Planctomycetota bacterium]
MLYWLFTPLTPYFQGFNLFHYISFRAAFAAILSFLIVLVCGPGLVAWLRARKVHGCVDHDSKTIAAMREGKQAVPTMGGLLILLAVAVSTLLLGRLDVVYVVVCLMAFVAFGALGAVDDWAKLRDPAAGGMSARAKLLGQFSIAGVALLLLYVHAHGSESSRFLRGPAFEPSPYVPTVEVAALDPRVDSSAPHTPIDPTEVAHPRADHRTDLQIPFFKHFCLDLGLLFLLFGALVVVGSSNAINLTDGLDGLATGCVAITVFAFAVVAYLVGRADTSEYLYVFHVPGAGELTVLCAALGGATLGFLWFNGFPATVFMGDTGSLALGGALGLVAIATRQEFTLLVAGGVFVLEVLSVIAQRRYFRATGGRRLFLC